MGSGKVSTRHSAMRRRSRRRSNPAVNGPGESMAVVSDNHGEDCHSGAIAYRRFETPSMPQHGITGPHYNLYRANQNPNNGRCFWQSVGAVNASGLPEHAILIERFVHSEVSPQ